jgi:hypothetical protein
VGVHRLGAVAESMQEAKPVEGQVGEVAVAVLDHQVEVHVVRGAEPARGQRAGDGHADDEGQGSQAGHEAERHRRVDGGSRRVLAGARRDLPRSSGAPGIDHQAQRQAQIGHAGDGLQHLALRERAAQAELAKPGRDPREAFEVVRFTDGVNSLDDVRPGMKLSGVVTNITAFGAFVDIGVHQDGLVHISQLADRFVRDANDVVKVQQHVEVTVIEVDPARKRIALSMRKNAAARST